MSVEQPLTGSRQLTVAHGPTALRYELILDDDVVGHADYALTGDIVSITHVETRPDHRGKDFAAQLMRGVLDELRQSGRRVRPHCAYAAAYMRRHPENNDLLS